MPESMDLIEDWNQWTLDSLGSTHALTKGAIIGPEKTWGKFVFTPMFGLLEDLRPRPQQTRQPEPVQQQNAPTTMQPCCDANIQTQDPCSNYDSNFVTPQRQRRLHFYSSQDMEQNHAGLNSDMDAPMTTRVMQTFSPATFYDESENTVVIRELDSPRSPPRISRIISTDYHSSPFQSNLDDQDYKLNVLVQAVDLVTLVEPGGGLLATDTLTVNQQQHAQSLRNQRNRRLRPSWD
jgi:hypothetical protein